MRVRCPGGADGSATRALSFVVRATQVLLRRWGPHTPGVRDPGEFSWTALVDGSWAIVRSEVDDVLEASGTEAFPLIEDAVAVSQGNAGAWRVFVLANAGRWNEENCHRCPRTAALARSVPGVLSAGFSVLEPGAHIPAHRGPFDGVLRYHLGVTVPDPDACRLRVQDRVLRWAEGSSLMFDDAAEHEAWNESDADRIVLVVEVLKPLPAVLGLVNRIGRRAIRGLPAGVDPAELVA